MYIQHLTCVVVSY